MRLLPGPLVKSFLLFSVVQEPRKMDPERTSYPGPSHREWQQRKPTLMSGASASIHVWSKPIRGPHNWVNTFPFGLTLLRRFFSHTNLHQKEAHDSLQNEGHLHHCALALNMHNLGFLTFPIPLHTNFSGMLTGHLQVFCTADLEEQFKFQ